MEQIRIISRSDDLGSSISANTAIARVVGAGFIKNVSIMACGPFVEDAAKRLAHNKDICFGMHTTLNAEWDKVKWGPVSDLAPDCGLLDENGYFLADPSMFLDTRPSVASVMQEVEAQYQKLCDLGFAIRYIDSHMFSEQFIPGMDEAIEAFAKAHGLLDHMYYYNNPPKRIDYSLGADAFKDVPGGQYLLITHPSLNTEEMRMTGNHKFPGEQIAAERARETMIFSDPTLPTAVRMAGVETIRYDEAVFGKRLTVADMK